MQIRSGPLIVACSVALSAGAALSIGTGGGARPYDLVALLVVGTIVHAIALAPALLAGRLAADRVPDVVIAGALFLGAVPFTRAGAAVNDPRGPIAVLAVGACAIAAAIGGRWLGPIARADVVAIGGCVVAAVAIGRAALPSGPERTSQGPDVVLITIDTLRADHVAYDDPAITPNLARLAAAGARFDQTIAAAPLTGPSHVAILTGRSAVTTGVVANGTPIGPHPEALPALLRANGWQTGAFVGAFPLDRRFGFDGGFHVYDSDFAAVYGLHQLPVVQLVDWVVPAAMPRERRADAVVSRAIAWLDRNSEPVFAWVHLYDPHAPYDPPVDVARPAGVPGHDGPPIALPGWWPRHLRDVSDATWLASRYDAEIAWTDAQVGRLLDAVDRRGRAAVIVLTADHGESLGEHGVWFDHGDDLYDPALRVPLIVRAPGIPAGTRIAAQVPSVDVAPTVLELVGVTDTFARDGRSRRPELFGAIAQDAPALATTLGARRADPPVDHALRVPSGKCYARHGEAPLWLDLVVDPGESFAAAPDRPDAIALCAELGRRVAGAKALPAGSDRDALEQLRALGYIDPR